MGAWGSSSGSGSGRGSGSWQLAEKREGTSWSKRGTRDRCKINKIPTEFVFFKTSPDESTVEVVLSLLAGTMGGGSECKMQSEIATSRRRRSGLATTDCCGMLRAFSCGGNIGQWKGYVVRVVRERRKTAKPAFGRAYGTPRTQRELSPRSFDPQTG